MRMFGVTHPYFLGLVSGHWQIPWETLNDVQIKTTNDRNEANLGVAVVVPAHKIMEVLNHPELIRIRDQESAKAIGTGESVEDTPEPK